MALVYRKSIIYPCAHSSRANGTPFPLVNESFRPSYDNCVYKGIIILESKSMAVKIYVRLFCTGEIITQ